MPGSQAPPIALEGAAPAGSPSHGATKAEVELTSARRRHANIFIELTWLVFLIWIYEWLEDFSPLRKALALRDAHSVLSLESKLGLEPERVLNQWLAHQHFLAVLASDFYSNAIFAVTFGMAVVLYWRRPDLYRPLRNLLVLTNMVAFVVFWTFPVAPPRMLPGFIDVVEKVGGLGSWHGSLINHADQLAAMPSMHLGYAVWCAIAAWRMSRGGRAKVVALTIGIGYPVLTGLVVMGTGNHYLVDVVAGTACTFLALAIVNVITGPDLVLSIRTARQRGSG